MAYKPRRIKPDTTTNYLSAIEVVSAEASATIAKGDIVAVTAAQDGSDRLQVKRALDGGAGLLETGIKFVAGQDIPAGETGVVRPWYIETGLNTSGDSVGDPVYLSDGTEGARTTTAPAGSPIKVGHVLVSDATDGVYLLFPQAMALGS